MSVYSSNGKYFAGKNGNHPKKRRSWWSVGILLLILCLSVGVLIYNIGRVLQLNQAVKLMEHRAALVHSIEATAVPRTADQSEQNQAAISPMPVLEEKPEYLNHIQENSCENHEDILPQYVSLYEENHEMFGWVKIDGTRIDYPVMQSSAQDPEKYLHKDFSGKKYFSGTPFLDAACHAGSDQLLVYGHNMKNGSMFRDLFKYEDRSFWEQHPYIELNTLNHEYRFEIMAVLRDKVYYKTDTCFKFYQFIDAQSEEDFNEAVKYYQEHALYDTGVTAQYGDQLLTLVTCAYHTDDGKFLVVARKVPDSENQPE